MKERLNEFLMVIESSRQTEISILIALLTPGVIALFGAWVISHTEFPEPFQAFSAIRRPFAGVFTLLAAIASVRLGMTAYASYQRARDRLIRGK